MILFLMLNILAAITLPQDYGTTPVNNADISNVGAYTLISGNFVHHTSTNFGFTGVIGEIQSPMVSPVIGIANGTRLRLSFLCGNSSLTPSATTIIAYRFGVVVPVTLVSGSEAPIPPTDTNQITFDIDTEGREIDQFVIFIYQPAFDMGGWDISNISLTAVDTTYSDFNTGDRVLVYWDDEAEDFFVQREDNPGADLVTITGGPILTGLGRDNVSGVDFPRDPNGERPRNKSQFRTCSGTTLLIFGLDDEFPYMIEFDTPNAPECAIVPTVCDIHFTALPTVIDPDPFQNNGSVQLAAVSSKSVVRWTTDQNRFYNTIGNETGLFENLHAGFWTFYALDSQNCRIIITVSVGVVTSGSTPNVYNPKYRLQYYDVQKGVQSVIDIEERGFTGDVTDVKGSGVPLSLTKASGDTNDKFEVQRPTQAIFELISEKHFRFIGIFNQDDTKYRKKIIHGETSWLGFVVPSVYREEYAANKNYRVSITAADNLASLKNYDFLDDSGNMIEGNHNLLEIIAICLKKTSLKLNIRSAVNKFAAGQATGVTDDPLAQTFIDCATFYDDNLVPKKCDEVIDIILKPFGAFVQQVDSRWLIVEVDAQCSPYTYREVDYLASYVGNGSIDPQQEITTPTEDLENVIFIEKSHTLDVIPAYGTLSVNLLLNVKPSVLPVSLDKWQVNLASAGSIYSVITDAADPKKKYKGIKFTNFFSEAITGNHFAELTSPVFTTKSSTDGLNLSFTYKINYPVVDQRAFNRYRPPVWVRIIWRIKLTVGASTFYFDEVRGWNSDGFNENSLYATEYLGEDASFSRDIDLPNITPAALIGLQVSFKFEGALFQDFTNLAALKAIATVDLPVGTRIRGVIKHADWSFVVGSTSYFWYTLEAESSDIFDDYDNGDDPESNKSSKLPTVVRPTDYVAVTNQVVWKIDPESAPLIKPIDGIAISECRLKFLPNRQAPVENSKISFTNNANYKENLDYEVMAGDLPTGILQPEIYTNIFKNVDGTPTSGWKRKGFSENDRLQGILLRNLTNQYYKPTWRLGGAWMGPDIKFNTILKQTIIATELIVENEESPNVAPWAQDGSGQLWAYGAGAGPCKVSFSAVNVGNSLSMQQAVQNMISGIRVRIDFRLIRTLSSGARIDRFVVAFISDGFIVQKVTLADGLTADDEVSIGVSFNLDSNADTIAFLIENISGNGAGNATYELDYFRVKGVTSIRYYYMNSFERDDRNNRYNLEMVQLIPAIKGTDTDIDDTGGGDTDGGDGGGGGAGRAHSSGYSTGYS